MTKIQKIALCVLVVVLPVAADEVTHTASVVIDSDMGIDDAVAVALALQCPHIRLHSVVACEGVASREFGVQMLGRMLDEFNRGDVLLYAGAAPAGAGKPAPPFRHFAQKSIAQAMRGAPREVSPFTPNAYVDKRHGKTIVLAMGPLTNLAAALQDDAVRGGIERIIVQGSPDPARNWNIGGDPEALSVVRASGVHLQFVESGPDAAKPTAWGLTGGPTGQQTSIGEAFVMRLFNDPAFADHYTKGVFTYFTDELPLLACLDPSLFDQQASASNQEQILRPKDPDAIVARFLTLLSDGRQSKDRVVFAEGTLPDTILQPDVRRRKAGILSRNGQAEWFAQLLMNELHEHLGLYSIIGVKMGLRAAELLNAPQHGMQVVSHSAARPPVSCLNDGVIIATGSTPGRDLFRHEPGPAGSTRVTFVCNGRSLTLALKDDFRRKIKEQIDQLLKTHTLEDAEYWDGVRNAALDVWELWHRRELFDVVQTSQTNPMNAP